MLKKLLITAALVPLLAACEDSSGPGERGQQVVLRFASTTPTQTGVSHTLRSSADADPLVIEGSNGTLVIEDVRLIVAEFELEAHDGACESAGLDDDDCPDFEALPHLLDLPLTGGVVTVATAEIPAGTYEELEFEIEDLDLEDDDDGGDGDDLAKRQAIQNILSALRADYPEFPDDASMVVRGTFTPAGGTAQPFTVYFDAEIEIELDLVPPLTVPGTEAVTVMVDPMLWFRRGSEVIDLAGLNGRTVEFEAEIENGFTEVEFDD